MALERSGTNPCLDVPYLLTKNDAFLNRRILDIFTAPIAPGAEQQVELVGHEGPGVTGGPRLDENLAEAAEKILPIRVINSGPATNRVVRGVNGPAAQLKGYRWLQPGGLASVGA